MYLPCLLLLLPALAAAQYRRLHRSPLAHEYYPAEEIDDPCGSCVQKRLSYYGRRPHRSSCFEYPSYASSGSLNYLGAPHTTLGAPSYPLSKGIGGTICGPLGTTLKGQIGCGGISGSIVSPPLGTSISGSIGHGLPEPCPCRPCRPCGAYAHDITAATYL